MITSRTVRIGTRDSQLALWQANHVKDLLAANGVHAVLVPVKSEGDIDLKTPLYAMGVQGVFTRSLDIALLNNTIDIAVHSMKDVPVQLPQGITQAAVLQRASYKDILVVSEQMTDDRIALFLQRTDLSAVNSQLPAFIIGTSSVRRRAQWLSRYPHHHIENLRGNVNTRLQKVAESNWAGAIFAAAGLERIHVRPANAIELDWMLPAPAQGAIMVAARSGDDEILNACLPLNHEQTAQAVKAERDFLAALMGGCATPISALAVVEDGRMQFTGSVVSLDGATTITTSLSESIDRIDEIGAAAAADIIARGGKALIQKMQDDQGIKH